MTKNMTIKNLDWTPGMQYTCNDGNEYEVDCNGYSLDVKGSFTRITDLHDIRTIVNYLEFRKEGKSGK